MKPSSLTQCYNERAAENLVFGYSPRTITSVRIGIMELILFWRAVVTVYMILAQFLIDILREELNVRSIWFRNAYSVKIAQKQLQDDRSARKPFVEPRSVSLARFALFECTSRRKTLTCMYMFETCLPQSCHQRCHPGWLSDGYDVENW